MEGSHSANVFPLHHSLSLHDIFNVEPCTWLIATGVVTVVECIDYTHTHSLLHIMDDCIHTSSVRD